MEFETENNFSLDSYSKLAYYIHKYDKGVICGQELIAKHSKV